jgi:hypothetical protein
MSARVTKVLDISLFLLFGFGARPGATSIAAVWHSYPLELDPKRNIPYRVVNYQFRFVPLFQDHHPYGLVEPIFGFASLSMAIGTRWWL